MVLVGEMPGFFQFPYSITFQYTDEYVSFGKSKIQQAFGSQNHEKRRFYDLKLGVITAKHEANVVSHRKMRFMGYQIVSRSEIEVRPMMQS